jgi:hypothetical protein
MYNACHGGLGMAGKNKQSLGTLTRRRHSVQGIGMAGEKHVEFITS